MSDDTIRYRGKPVDEMTIEELRIALSECIRYVQEIARMHQEHMQMLRSLAHIDDDRQQRLFVEHSR